MKNLITSVCCLFAFQSFAQIADSADFYFQKGLDEKAARKYLLASKNFDKALTFNAKHTASLVENGNVNIEMRRTDAARSNFSKAYEIEPNNTTVIKGLMELYFNYRQFAKAIEMAEKCTDCPTAERIIAISHYQTEDYGKAEKTLLPLIAKNPTDAELNYTLGRTYLELENEAKAIMYYEKAVQLDTTKGAWLQELGLISYNANNYNAAVTYFNKAASNGVIQSNDFRENLGYSYIYAGKFDEGEKILMDLQQRKPGNKDIIRDLAQAYYDFKKYDRSLDYCQKLLEMDANDAKALYQAGKCFQKKGETSKGQGMCDKAIEMDPTLGKLRKQNGSSMGL